MRISNAQIFEHGVAAMMKKQAQLHETEMQLTSGLRIMKPSDDPSGAVKILNLDANIEVLDQYQRNTAVAESSLAYEESVLVSVNDSIQRIRELTVQGNNATNSNEDRASIATEIYSRLDELLALANTRDANGEYIFGGNRVNLPPFVDSNGVVSYVGDQGERSIQIGESTQVVIRDSGEDIFQSIQTGDGIIEVQADAGNTGTAVLSGFGLNGTFVRDTYTVTFNQATAADPVTYTVTDSTLPVPNVVTTGTYSDGASITFAGAQFQLDGQPDDGDVVVLAPSRKQDVFASIKAIADALDSPSFNEADTAIFHNRMAEGLANLDQVLDSVNNIRGKIGARLNNVDALNNINDDFKLQLETVLSETRDLDYAEAISRFNLQLTSLQAAQQAFIRASGLSLFQYL